jgi:hypothetical protein
MTGKNTMENSKKASGMQKYRLRILKLATSAKIKNAWSVTSTPVYALKHCN